MLMLTLSGLAYPQVVLAYIGPGLAGGAISAILGVLGAILMLLVGVIWYPLKRVIRHFRSGGRGA